MGMEVELNKPTTATPAVRTDSRANTSFQTNADQLGLSILQSKPRKPFRLYREPVIHYSSRRPIWDFSKPPIDLILDPRSFDVSPGIDGDFDRYEKKLRNRAEEELKGFRVRPNDMIARRGDQIVSIPVPQITIPEFHRGSNRGGGVGAGEGEIGQPIGKTGNEEEGQGESGDQPGNHIREEYVRMSRADIGRLLMENLKLPNLQPKGNDNIKQTDIKWTEIARKGKGIDFYRTLFNAIERNGSAVGPEFKLEDLSVEDSDVRFNSWKITEKPHASAVIIYIMDVSGSMTDEAKDRVRAAAWYLSTIIQTQFGIARAEIRGETFRNEDFGSGIEEAFIVHDAKANEVGEEEFYTTRESGGTRISTGLEKAKEIIQKRYPPASNNIYIFQFSDGDNWGEDNSKALELLEEFSTYTNAYGYIQIDTQAGSGDFIKEVRNKFGGDHNIVRIAELGRDDDDDEYKDMVSVLLEDRGGNS